MVSEPAPTRAVPNTRTIAGIRAAQNFPIAAAAGVAAAIVGAGLWAVVTVTTHMRLGLFSVALGMLVGYAIRKTGQGYDKKFGYLGIACALLGCALGDVISDIAYYADIKSMPLTDAIATMTPEMLVKLATIFFKPIDLLFYAIALYEGYRFSFAFRKAFRG